MKNKEKSEYYNHAVILILTGELGSFSACTFFSFLVVTDPIEASSYVSAKDFK